MLMLIPRAVTVPISHLCSWILARSMQTCNTDFKSLQVVLGIRLYQLLLDGHLKLFHVC